LRRGNKAEVGARRRLKIEGRYSREGY
jgi:hypothetical protein